MFDMHCHILPGIDDGAKNWDDSLHMSRMAAQAGVRTLVATPHCSCGLQPNIIINLVEELNRRIDEEQLDLRVVPGMEVYLDPELPARLKSGEIVTVGENCVLVELPFNSLPVFTDAILFQVMLMGYQVILAHPERNLKVVEKPELVYEWVSRGIMIQVNSGSILGKFGSKVKGSVELLIQNNLVHFLGTDAHGPTGRCPDLGEAAERLAKLTSQYRKITSENGEFLLQGEFEISQSYSEPKVRAKTWWQNLLSKA